MLRPAIVILPALNKIYYSRGPVVYIIFGFLKTSDQSLKIEHEVYPMSLSFPFNLLLLPLKFIQSMI